MTSEQKIYKDEKIAIEELSSAMLIGAYMLKEEKQICIEHLNELERLAQTYGFTVTAKEPCHIRKHEAKTFFTKGKIEELAELAKALEIDVIIIDDEITPNQQKNLEEMFEKPLLDRTELIIEVFAQRAHTKEASLQIELAKIRYQLPRLKRLWTHLSRQRVSGKGYLKGEGEKQIEIDRRILRNRISRLEKEIKEVRKQRELQRKARMRSTDPTFAIVGYTNVGKSTLINALTNAGVLEEDKLFATLDTTTRKYILPNHQSIMLVDTVGFIRKLPHTLVAAFKSTLEEACFTDILIHVIDISHPDAENQALTTLEVLKELGASDKPTITILNKIDAIENPGIINKFRLKFPHAVPISAKNKEGFDLLMETIMELLASLRKVVKLIIPQSHYYLVSKLQREGNVLECDYEGNDIVLQAEIPSILEKEFLPFIQES